MGFFSDDKKPSDSPEGQPTGDEQTLNQGFVEGSGEESAAPAAPPADAEPSAAPPSDSPEGQPTGEEDEGDSDEGTSPPPSPHVEGVATTPIAPNLEASGDAIPEELRPIVGSPADAGSKYRVKHPTVLFGPFAGKFHAPTVNYGTREVNFKGEIKNGILEITPEMGGKHLVDYLVRHENFTDLSDYKFPPAAPKPKEKKVIGYIMQIPNANAEKPQNGSTGILMIDGSSKQLAIKENLVTLDSTNFSPAEIDRAKVELLRAGFQITQAIVE